MFSSRNRFEAETKQITKATKSPIVQVIEAVGAISERELQTTPTPVEFTAGKAVQLRPFRGAYPDSNRN